MTRTKALIVLVAFLCLAAGFADFQVFHLGGKLSADEARTCQIQARGLPAGHELSAAMVDIYALLTVRPTSRAQRLAAKNETPHVKALVADLTAHLAKYKAAEASEPHGRTC